MKFLKLFRKVTLLLALLFMTDSIFSQIKGKEFRSRIPAAAQKELKNRLDLFVEYQRLSDWEKLFDLLYEKRDKKTFVEDQIKSPNDGNFLLMGFSSLTAIFPDPSMPNWLIVEGCAHIRQSGAQEKQLKAFTNAYNINGVWFFTMIELSGEVGKDPDSCDCVSR